MSGTRISPLNSGSYDVKSFDPRFLDEEEENKLSEDEQEVARSVMAVLGIALGVGIIALILALFSGLIFLVFTP